MSLFARGPVRRTRSGIRLTLSEAEVALIRQLVSEIAELVADDPVGEVDPLADLVGFDGSPRPRPTDPVLARLLPDGYQDDDEAAGEFRRFTERSLRQLKSEAAATVLASLPQGGGSIDVDDDGAQAWIGALNDVRLALGIRLEVTDDGDDPGRAAALADPTSPAAYAYAAYDYLTALQDALIRAVAGW